MRYRYNSGRVVEDLLKISLKTLRVSLQREGYSLGAVEELLLQRPGSYVTGTLSFSRKDWEGRVSKVGEVGYSFRMDREGLYLQLDYNFNGDPRRLRYYLAKRESNLIPGSYRYYFLDPYSENPEGLFSNLYLWDGDFIPRSLLSSFGVYYRQETEGHTQRRVWTPYHRLPEGKSLKYRKTHYRGRVTPFWGRYLERSQEIEGRVWDILERYHLSDGKDRHIRDFLPGGKEFTGESLKVSQNG